MKAFVSLLLLSVLRILPLELSSVKEEVVSDRLLGFNVTYANSPDEMWADGKLIEAMASVRPGFLRYPGGTVTTFYHWNALTGNGWTDAWDPSYSVSDNKPDTEFLTLDEYFDIVERTGGLPMLGVNCNSAFVYGRLEEGIGEALAMMRYVKEKGHKVRYWYMGNEPFARDGNGGTWSMEQYAEMILAFAPRMKALDPEIKIVANASSNFVRNWPDIQVLLDRAGPWIDVIDVHFYWSHGTANWERWTSITPCTMWGGNSFEAEVGYFHRKAAEAGYPNLELATLEWNCGPSTRAAVPLTTSGQLTLIPSEMLTQFMRGGMDMACFWPLFWGGSSVHRGFVHKFGRELLPVAYIMRDLGAFQGLHLIECQGEDLIPNSLVLAVKDPSDGTVRLAFLNKTPDRIAISLQGAALPEGGMARIKSYHMDASLLDIIREDECTCDRNRLLAEPFSLTIVVL